MTSEKQACLYAYPSFVIFSGPVFLMLMGAMYFFATVLQTALMKYTEEAFTHFGFTNWKKT